MARTETHRDGAVLTIVNNDPATKNALSAEFYVGAFEALKAAEADPSVRAVVLTGANGFFCSGGNITSLRERAAAGLDARRGNIEKLHALIRVMRTTRLPILCAVEGGAAGAGGALAVAGDLLVASRTAYVALSYVKIGLTPDGGSTLFYGRGLPRQLLQEMVWTGDRVPVERLHQLGMVNRLVEPGTALATAQEWAARLAEGPAEAMAGAKRLVEAVATATMDEQLDAEADCLAAALGGPEAREGLSAFLEKRPADFRTLGTTAAASAGQPNAVSTPRNATAVR